MWANGGKAHVVAWAKWKRKPNLAFNRGLVCVVRCSTLSPLELHIHHVGFWSNADSSLHTYREELLLLKQDADRKMKKLQIQCQELQSVIKQVSEDFQKVSRKPSQVIFFAQFQNVCLTFVFQSQDMVSTLEGAVHTLQTEHDALKLKQEKVWL